MVRIYVTEADHIVSALIRHLHEVAKVEGVSVFRAISGYGHSGRLHTSALLELSLALPLVVEFFDTPERIDAVLPTLTMLAQPRHIVTWDVRLYD
jgi:PII-like signaling protein